MAYTTEAKVENYLLVDIDSSFSNQITSWISAVENYINNYTGKSFEGATETRYFDGNDKEELFIDDFISLTSVIILEYSSTDTEYTLTEGWGDDFVVYPLNETPKYKLVMSPNSQVGTFLGGKRRIKITGSWGHSTSVPADIELAATMLVASIVEKGLKGGTPKTESLGDYSATYTDIDQSAQILGVKKILDKYKVFEL